jgi:hypothetical protein
MSGRTKPWSERRDYIQSWVARNADKRRASYAAYNASRKGRKRAGYQHLLERMTMEQRVRRVWNLFRFPKDFLDPGAM